MTLDPRRQAQLLFFVAALCLVGSVAFAARLGFTTTDRRAEQAEIAAGEKRVAELGTPRLPTGLHPLVRGPSPTLAARAGEVLNVELGNAGLSVTSVETTFRRPFGDGLESLFITVRASGDSAAGLKALGWMMLNHKAIAVESATAYPAQGANADWTFKLIVLAAPSGASR